MPKNNLIKNIKILKHNQISIKDYNSDSFSLVPFPSRKIPLYNFDNLATSNSHVFLKDKKFLKSKLKAEKRWKINNVRQISWRLHFILFYVGACLRTATKQDIFLECGVGRGYMAAAICDYFRWNENKPEFFLVDTFLPNSAQNNINQKENGGKQPFCYTSDIDEVKKYFDKYKNIKILKGFCPDVINKLPAKKIIYCHLDLNNYESELKTFKYLLKKNYFRKGAVVIFDDFGEYKTLAKKLVLFLKKIKKEVLMSPTGQGIVII